MTAALKPY